MSIKVRASNRGRTTTDNFIPDTKVSDRDTSVPVEADFTTEESHTEPVAPKQTRNDLKNVDEDFGGMEFDTVWSDLTSKSKKNLPIAVDNDSVDLSGVDIVSAEAEFRNSELDSQITPVVQKKVKEAIHQTVALNNDRMKISMTEVLDEYNSERLKELKKDRKKRQNRRRFWSIVKFIAVFVIIAVLMTNAQIRARVGIIFQDTKKLVIDIFNDDATTSNNVADDFIDNLGTHLNEVNTYEVEEVEE